LATIFDSLPQDKQDAILNPKDIGKLPTKDPNKASVSPAKSIDTEPKDLPQQLKKQKKKLEDEENEVVGPNTSQCIRLYLTFLYLRFFYSNPKPRLQKQA